MTMRSKCVLLIFALYLVCGAPVARAADVASLESQMRELSQVVGELRITVERQQAEIAALKGERALASPPAAGPALASSRSLLGKWNPDIGVVADTVLTLDSPKEDAEGADRISVRELELIFGSNVDPYSRLDATLAISDFEEMALEEGYLTRFGLPLGATARIGRFKPRVGKAIPTHRDALDTVDEPLVIQRWFGLEGYNKSGADLTLPIDLPWPVTHGVSVGVLEGGNGEDGTAFGEARRNPTLYTHLKNYIELGDTTGLEVGGNYLIGSKDDDEQFDVYIAGVDGTLIHHLNPQQSIKLQAEGYFMERQDGFADTEDPDTLDVSNAEFDDSLWGTYGLLDFRFAPQWATGFRYDYVQLVNTEIESASPDGDLDSSDRADEAYNWYLTFYQSEFARWRLQLTHEELSESKDNDKILIQGTFAIGEHKHKLQ